MTQTGRDAAEMIKPQLCFTTWDFSLGYYLVTIWNQ